MRHAAALPSWSCWGTTLDPSRWRVQQRCVHACYSAGVDRVGIRELRNNVAALVRRAAAGERLVVTVDGVPTAQLGPLDGSGARTVDDLVATGLAQPPGRTDRPPAPEPEDAPVDVRPDSVLDELRGR